MQNGDHGPWVTSQFPTIQHAQLGGQVISRFLDPKRYDEACSYQLLGSSRAFNDRLMAMSEPQHFSARL